MRGWRAWARPHGHSAVRPCVNLFPVLYPHGNSAVLDGSPLHSGHALHSTLFSLFPTLEAHCIVTTHCFLPSSPCSLLWKPTA